MNAHTERLSLTGSAGAIEAVRDAAALTAGAAPRGVVVIAHPHPLFGGSLDNKVVQTLARAFVQCGWTAVRFNFRGVGASAGGHDEGRGEMEDFLAVVEQVAPEGPLALAGFSFGAFVTSHALAALWPQRHIEQVVLVGTAASRFEVAAVPPPQVEPDLRRRNRSVTLTAHNGDQVAGDRAPFATATHTGGSARLRDRAQQSLSLRT